MIFIIIRSRDDINWERYSEWEEVGSYDDKLRRRTEYQIKKYLNFDDYWWEIVGLDYFNEFKKPYV